MPQISHLTPRSFILIHRGAAGDHFSPLQASGGTSLGQAVKAFEVQPGRVLHQLQLAASNMSPHAPAKPRIASFPQAGTDISSHLSQIVHAELSRGRMLQGSHQKRVGLRPQVYSESLHVAVGNGWQASNYCVFTTLTMYKSPQHTPLLRQEPLTAAKTGTKETRLCGRNWAL
ncbi:Hypothetical predicted protein [Pelobates cultripes]|uniref:Uncharacterized protein n=1 Tax=Pelobates cultripes TaxID=61616 RepID=A0AAD1SNM0_PELCU|nr:Hypothetical predicted protein [Pelobates cultripes]